jgi:hypothetical protein
MGSAEESAAGSIGTAKPGTVDMGLEVVTLAVADIEGGRDPEEASSSATSHMAEVKDAVVPSSES